MEKWEDNFNKYLQKYCKSRNISSEEAVQHKIVQETRKYYEKMGDTDISAVPASTWAETGCCK